MGYIMDLRKVIGHKPIIIAGAGVIFVNEKNEILLHERADNHFWSYPAGSLELGETFEDAAKREAFEESGLIADKLEFFTTRSGEETHYIYPHGDEIYVAGVLFICREFHGELKVQEEEVVQQRFFAEDDLPSPLAPTSEKQIRDAFRFIREHK